MATGTTDRPNVPSWPAASPFAAAAPPNASPFLASGSIASRPDGLSVRPPISGPTNTMPFSYAGPIASKPDGHSGRPPPMSGPTNTMPFSPAGPMTGPSGPPSFRPTPSVGFVNPSTLGPPGPPTSNQFQRFAAPQFPNLPQPTLSRPSPVGPPNMAQPPIQPIIGPSHPGFPGPSSPAAFLPPPQTPSFQIAPPPQPYSQVPQPGFGQPLPHRATATMGGGREHVQQPFSAHLPPTSTMKDLIEDFSSVSIATAPGSMDTGLDPKALPRALDGDVEPKACTMYPLNCTPKFLRFTSCIPNSQSLASRWHLPLGAVVCPLAETSKGEEVPVVDFSLASIIRCRRCQAFVNLYVEFTDGGRKWLCNLCAFPNEVSGEYFSQLDSSGRRLDADQRPELTRGSVDYVASDKYMARPPMPPVYFFLIDVSVSAVRSGMLEVVAQTIKSCLDELPGCPRTQIGFLTFDSSIHFYNMKSALRQPQMMVVSDIDDVFIPLPDDLLVNLSESRIVVESFLDSLVTMFQDTTNMESAFGPAVKAASMIMQRLGGKMLIFLNSLPSIGVGRLKLRGEDIRIYGTDKEHSLRIAEDTFYKQMAAECTKNQIGVNVYAFSDKYTDVASLGTLSKYTGGQVNYYPSFKSVVQKDKLRYELARDLTRETAWEAVMRIRCGKGVRRSSYHGNFMLKSNDLLAFPSVDCDKAFAMQLCLEDTLLTTQTVHFQVSLVHTTSCGERRLRVHTAAVPVVADLGEMYRQADTGAIVSVLSRLAIEITSSSKLDDARTYLLKRIVKAFKEYRNLHDVQHRLAGRMIYPESLKCLPLYVLALCKSTPLRGGFSDVQLDERCAIRSTLMTLPVKTLLKFLYPSLIRVDGFLLKASSPTINFKDVEESMPHLPLTAESLDSRGLYIFYDGLRFVIWIGSMLSPEVARSLNVDYSSDLSQVNLRESEHEMSRRLMRLLNKLRENNPAYYQLCHLVRQGEQPREGFYLLANLIEDQSGGTSGYVDWIMQIHRQIQQNA